ncbi:MAG: monovalent cation/H(+) antiporter subunit G [Deltaproteobacteria bacterium]|nr:monovalent cation/H(+) antiporter subunit G [Deltaproteobacteria bacterium]
MEIISIIAGIFIFTGCFFIFVAAIGLVRFPDFYSRIHAAGKCDTMGLAMVLLGLIVYEGFSLVSLKLLIIIAFVFIANPTATHALANAALVVGLKHWKKGDKEGGSRNDY